MNWTEIERNNHSDVAKNQHLVPQTYMRAWSYNGNNSVWVLDKGKLELGWKSRNVEKINCINNFHDIKAGDMYTTEDSLKEIFGILDGFTITFPEGVIDSYDKMNEFIDEYDEWSIIDPNGHTLCQSEKNTLKSILKQARYTFIETEWCKQYEDEWRDFISSIESKLRVMIGLASGEEQLTPEEIKRLLTYLVIYDWRNKTGNSILHSLMQVVGNAMPEFKEEYGDSPHKNNKTSMDVLEHGFRTKAYDDFLHGRPGVISNYIDQYNEHLSFDFVLTDQEHPFLTSDCPAFMFVNEFGIKEHILVATPTLLLTTIQPKNRNKFIITNSTAEGVERYNKFIASQAELVISNRNDWNIAELIG